MRRAPRRRPPPLQRHPGHRVAQHVRVPLLQLLVKLLHREARVALLVQPQHAQDLLLCRPTARWLADPPSAQTLWPLLAQPVVPTPECAPDTPSNSATSPCDSSPRSCRSSNPSKRICRTPCSTSAPAHSPPPFRGVSKTGQITRYKTGQITTQSHEANLGIDKFRITRYIS
jgi:hypothetical protein